MEPNYRLTSFDVQEQLGLSRKTVFNYVKTSLLFPRIVLSKKGTKKFMFSEKDLEALSSRLEKRIGEQTGVMKTEVIQTEAKKSEPKKSSIMYSKEKQSKEEQTKEKESKGEQALKVQALTVQLEAVEKENKELHGEIKDTLKEQLTKQQEMTKEFLKRDSEDKQLFRQLHLLLANLQQQIPVLTSGKQSGVKRSKAVPTKPATPKKPVVKLKKQGTKKGFFKKLFG